MVLLKVSLGVRWCSTRSEECQELVEFIKESQFEMPSCDEASSNSAVTLTGHTPSK